MKTLHLTNAFHPTSGGIHTTYRAFLDAANRLRHDMRLIVPGESTRVEEVGPFGRIYYIRAPHSPIIDSSYRMMLPHTYLLPGGAVRRILIDEQPDLVEINDKYSLNWLAGITRKQWIGGLKRPVLVGLSCERMDDNVASHVFAGRLGQRFARFYMKQLYTPLFDYHIANSEYTAEELLRALGEKSEGRVYVRHKGVDCAIYDSARRNAAVRKRLLEEACGTAQSRLLLYVGRLSREKNVALLVDLMERLAADETNDYRLLVIGTGPLVDWLKQSNVKRAGGRLRLLDYIADKRALADVYASADAFVHPNPREPFGLCPLEAMASGLPLVVPNAGGVLAYANETNAWLAQPTAVDFADAISAVFADTAITRNKVEAARRTAARFDWETMSENFFELYDALHRKAAAPQRARAKAGLA